jgi:signal transduction histidine kinase
MPGIEVRKTSEATSSETLLWVNALAAAVSHEINNPLTVIVGNLQLLARTPTLDADGHARVSAALTAAVQITERIRRFGLITRLELATGEPNPPMLDIEKPSVGLSVTPALCPDAVD